LLNVVRKTGFLKVLNCYVRFNNLRSLELVISHLSFLLCSSYKAQNPASLDEERGLGFGSWITSHLKNVSNAQLRCCEPLQNAHIPHHRIDPNI